jgi:DNA-binding beta-propeller fold protein YncE
MRTGVAFLAVVLAGGCGDDGAASFHSTCTPSAASAEAQLPVGPHPDHPGARILIDGRLLTPVGTQRPLGGFPLAMRFIGGGTRFLAVTDGGKLGESLRVVDLQSGLVVASEPYDPPHGLYFGLATSADGRRLYASGGGEDVVHVLDVDPASGAVTPAPDIDLPGFPAGLALSADGQQLLVARQQGAAGVAVVNLQSGQIVRELSTGGGVADLPSDIAVAPAQGGRDEAYVTLTGGGALAVLDLQSGAAARIPVGKNPEAVLVMPGGGRALVTVSDEDTVAVVDLAARQVVQTVPVALETAERGASPSALAVSPDGARVYVALAAENSLVALSTADAMPIGRLPMGWYPSAVAVAADGTVAVANAKGESQGPTDGQTEKSELIQGTLTLLGAPSDADLAAGTAAVRAASDRPHSLEARPQCQEGAPARFPLPLAAGDPTPIEHVILIVRENKTYDAELGSLAGARGDPSLEIFGPQMTPNLHALAQSFAHLDNFYSNAEASLQGHVLTTAAFVGDLGERTWLQTQGRQWRGEIPFSTPVIVPSGFIWQRLDASGVTYLDMGEVVGTTSSPVPVHLDEAYPGLFFDLDVSDADRAAYFERRLARADTELPRFTYLILPRNHTYAMQSGQEAPESMIADNDEATGRVVDALSHSKYWSSSIVFIIEDDPQDGGDHVDGHRSICVVASPWVRRGAVSSAIYDMGSLFRTLELLLGVGPLVQADARAAAMYDLFAATSDPRPFGHVSRQVPVSFNPTSGPLAEASAGLDFSAPDRAPETARILWQHFKGSQPPWPRRVEEDSRRGPGPAGPAGGDDDDD